MLEVTLIQADPIFMLIAQTFRNNDLSKFNSYML